MRAERRTILTSLTTVRRYANTAAGPALRRASVGEATWLHLDCRADVGVGHRREYGDFQCRQRRVAAPAALPRAAAAGARLQRIPADELAQRSEEHTSELQSRGH